MSAELSELQTLRQTHIMQTSLTNGEGTIPPKESPTTEKPAHAHIAEKYAFLICTRSKLNDLHFRSARVVLPTEEPVDTDEEVEEEEVAEGDNGDFLVDFPDNTEVRIHRLPLLSLPNKYP